MKITLKNQKTGEYKITPIGYSWTNLFFGFLVPICRADWKWAIIQGVLGIITSGLSWLVIPFFYNKWYIKDLINKGFLPEDILSSNVLIGKGIITTEQLELACEGKEIQEDIISKFAHKVSPNNNTDTGSSAIEQIEKLSALKESGVITQQEFEEKKEALLKKI